MSRLPPQRALTAADQRACGVTGSASSTRAMPVEELPLDIATAFAGARPELGRRQGPRSALMQAQGWRGLRKRRWGADTPRTRRACPHRSRGPSPCRESLAVTFGPNEAERAITEALDRSVARGRCPAAFRPSTPGRSFTRVAPPNSARARGCRRRRERLRGGVSGTPRPSRWRSPSGSAAKLRWIERLAIKSATSATAEALALRPGDDPDNVPDGCEGCDAAAIIPAKDVSREGARQRLSTPVRSARSPDSMFRYFSSFTSAVAWGLDTPTCDQLSGRIRSRRAKIHRETEE